MTIVQVLPAPENWVVFHYTAEGATVSDWFWQPLAYVAHCIDEGQMVILPVINGRLPIAKTDFIMSHPVTAMEWIYDDTNIVERESLERYLKAVQP